MVCIRMSKELILSKNLENLFETIPAYLDDGHLIVGHNDGSILANYPDLPFDYDAEDYKFFCNHEHRDGSISPYFEYKGIPYLLRQLNANMLGFQFTALSQCPSGTYFCKCDVCGDNFVVCNDEIESVSRCNACIMKGKPFLFTACK